LGQREPPRAPRGEGEEDLIAPLFNSFRKINGARKEASWSSRLQALNIESVITQLITDPDGRLIADTTAFNLLEPDMHNPAHEGSGS
jgi:hypothetical protein